MRGVKKGAIILGLILWAGAMPFMAEALSPEVKNLGSSVNSGASDFSPVVSPDGKYLFFTSTRADGLGGQDVWVSERVDGQWGDPVNLGAPVNNAMNQGADSFFSDGEKDYLYLTFCRPEEEGFCDIYVSEKNNDDGSWGRPWSLGYPINTDYSDANATWDYRNNVMYFSSTRPGGISGDGPIKQKGAASYDLWRCKLEEDGDWGEPEHLGSDINTDKWEGVAFFHSSSSTLYFSSNGHKEGDDADIYRSREIGDNRWSEPELVDMVQTDGNDMYFSIPASGDVAYFSSNARLNNLGFQGLEDIYIIPLDLLLTPEELAKRTLTFPESRTRETGPGAGHIETIYFDFDRSNIRASEVDKLKKVMAFLEENPGVKIEVHGHACSVGNNDYNLVLSKNRAQSVYKYLMRHKVNPNRMEVTYYGETRPAEPNDPTHGNALNRRVEISIKQ